MRRLLKLFLGISLITFAQTNVWGSDVVKVIPLTDSILMVHFDDGFLDYGGSGETDIVMQNPLDVEKASKTSAYRLISGDDPDYLDFKSPLKIGRKSKPMETSNECNWVKGDDGKYLCDNEVIMEHWIYLVLPNALEKDKTYTLWLGGLAKNMDEITFVFDEKQLRSEAVHVNTVGYTPDAPIKYGYIGHWMGDLGSLILEKYEGNACYLVDATNPSNVFPVGDLTKRRGIEESQKDYTAKDRWGDFNNFFGGDVYECDFSSFNTPGEYVLVVEGIGSSYPFKISEDAYTAPFYHTIRGLYHQRAGIELKEPYTKWTRGRDHHPDEGDVIMYTTVKSNLMGENKDLHAATVENATEELNTWGWYHDAGDWDGYIHHAKVPFYLFSLYELNPALFGDNELNIPQFQNGVELAPGTGNGIPDILDEASWLVEYYRRNIRPNGGVCGGRIHSDMNDKPGGVTSAGDTRTFYAGAEDPHTTFLFAGLAATYAWTLEMAGVADSTNKLIQEAETAYTWASSNITSEDQSIEVDGKSVDDLKLYAAVCLFKMTGKQEYFDDIETLNEVTTETSKLSDNAYNNEWSSWIYTTIPDDNLTIPGSLELKETIKAAVIKYSNDQFVSNATQSSVRIGMNRYIPPVIGFTTTPDIIIGAYAYNIADGVTKEEILQYMHGTCDYFLGGNPLNITWITGFGDYHPTRMLHLDSKYDNKDEMFMGLVPYGPTQRDIWGKGAMGPFDSDFTKIRSYPDMYDWPISEMFYNTRYGVMDGEFTIHQNNNKAAMAYGFLSGGNASFQPNARPQISLSGVSEDQIFNEKDTLKLTVNATDDEWVQKVEFYLDYHKIGETKNAPFNIEIPATKLFAGNFKLYAKVIDNEGAHGYSDSISVEIIQEYTFSITSPSPTDTVNQGDDLSISVEIPDFADATIEKVEIYNSGALISTHTSAPYTTSTPALPRNNVISAVCYFEEGFTSESSVTTYARPSVSGVQLNTSALSIFANEYARLVADVFPEDAENREVDWSSANTDICTIDENGLIIALAEGTTTITVETRVGGYQDKMTITVKPARQVGPYNGVPSIIPGKIEAEDYDIGGEGFAYHDNTPGNQKNEYRSDGVDIEKTYDAGTAYSITNIEAGEWVNYTVYVAEDNYYDVTLRMTFGSDDLLPKIKFLLNNKDISGTIDLPNVGWYPLENFTINDLFLPQGKHVLTMQVVDGPFTISYFDFSCSSCTTELPTDFSIEATSSEIAVGETLVLTGSFTPSSITDQTVYWKSLNEEIATINSQGMVTAVSEGSVSIAAETKLVGFTDTINLTITPGSFTDLNAFEFTNNSISLHVGEQILPEMQFTPADATDKKVYFTSSNSTIAKVNEYGFIEALRNGNAIIYGTSRDGFYKDNIAIEVTNDAPVVSITAPEDLTSFSIDQSITVVADASDDLRVAAIEIFVNNQSVGTVTKAPWQLTLENVNSGYNSLTVKATDDHDGVTWAGPVRFYVDDPNAIPELLYKPINVYPNPAKKAIHFSIMPKEPAGMHVQIYNINGQKVISDYMEVLPSVEVNMSIDIQNLNSGMYFYRIIMDSSGKVNTINGNFIKQ